MKRLLLIGSLLVAATLPGCDDESCAIDPWRDVPFYKTASDEQTYAFYFDGWSAAAYPDDITAAEAIEQGSRYIVYLDIERQLGTILDARELDPERPAAMVFRDARGVPALWAEEFDDAAEFERAFERLSPGTDRSHHSWHMDGEYEGDDPVQLLIKLGAREYEQLLFVPPEHEPDGFIKLAPTIAAYGREIRTRCDGSSDGGGPQ